MIQEIIQKHKADLKILGSIALIVIASRLIIFFTAYAGLIFFQHKIDPFWPSMNGLWNHWDSYHYLSIAQEGYPPASAPVDRQSLIVFGPLYPLFIRFLGGLVHDLFLAGLLVSNLSLIIGGLFLYKLASLDYDSDTAWRAVKYLLVYPFSFFLSITFSEGLFLALFVGATYFLRTKAWVYSGILAMMAVLTRPNTGPFLGIILIVEYMQEVNILEIIKNKLYGPWAKDLFNRSFVVLGLSLGVFIYLLINKLIFDDWWKFIYFKKTQWYVHYIPIMDNIKDLINRTFIDKSIDSLVLWGPQLVSFFMALILIFITMKRVRLSYVIYSLSFIFYIYSIFWLLSCARHMSTVFPLFLSMAVLSKNKSVDIVLTFLMTAGLIFYALLFSQGCNLL
ncbi:MAG: hypothetical protein HQL16_00140 [Candidatus Omnitrophica bacterium]|nr:hypothetical protein [Candidatus Omnitrophota bacterium]